MPIWLRRTTFNLLREHYDKQNEEQEKQNKMLNGNKNKEVARPNIPQPTYTTKAPKK
jgi:hypothetical protein